MRINGAPERLLRYEIQFFYYAATGEGVTVELTFCEVGEANEVGFDDCTVERIPVVIEKTGIVGSDEQRYLDWNPRFEVIMGRFLGRRTIDSIIKALDNDLVPDVTFKMRLNLS